MTVFVLRSSRSDVVDNCSEKSEKTPRKTPMEVYFINFRWQETLSHGRFLGIFFEWLSAEISLGKLLFYKFPENVAKLLRALNPIRDGSFRGCSQVEREGVAKRGPPL